MQRVAEALKDSGGSTTATGTANSLSVAASSAFTTLANGRRVTFRAASDNTGASTLNVNGIGGKPLVKFTDAGETALAAGNIKAANVYDVLYSEALNSGAGAWILTNPTPIVVKEPSGFIIAFGGTTAPTGYLSCDGAAVSRSTYADLFAAIGTTWGVGNGTTTFNLPDLRNDFLRGASGTLTVGTKQADTIESHTHSGTTSSNGAHTHRVPTGGSGGGSATQTGPESGTGVVTESAGAHTHTFTTNATGSSETRPRNGVVLWVIKT